MKTKLLFIALLSTFTMYSQTQIGDDIDGEAANDASGWSVSLSSDGSIVAIGGYGNDGNGEGSGHVRVYENVLGIWTQIGSDIDGEADGDRSGDSVSLSSDGSIVAIGATFNNENGYHSGHVRVYQNISDVWTQIGADINGEAGNDHSGHSVSLSSDGSILAIGAILNNNENGNASGHVRIYQNLSGVWTQIGADINGEHYGDNSGWSVSLSSDGSIVAIGAPLNSGNSGILGYRSGHVRVYQNMSGVWTQIGQDIDGEAEDDQSGQSVSLSSDGSIVAIGARYNDENGIDSGHVRVYQNLSGVWTQIGTDIDGETQGDWFGNSVSLSSDGNILAVGATNNNENGYHSGHVRIFQNNSSAWTQIGVDIDGEAGSDNSGWSVSLTSDGSTVAIGAPGNDENGNASGHVLVYDLSGLLSLEANEIAKKFTLYPNPVTNQLQIQVATSLGYNNATIYNYFGQLVLQSKTTTIDVSSLAAGVYFIEVETNAGKGVKRFIKK
jgi:Flp pilus assembly pilin Flp